MEDFDRIVDRRGSDSYKWDEGESRSGDVIPMWVADMDFQAPACVREAVGAWAAHGAYGYYQTPDRYYDAFLRWEKEEHGFAMEREWLRFSPFLPRSWSW